MIKAVEDTFSCMGITCADVNAMASGSGFDGDPLCAQAPALRRANEHASHPMAPVRGGAGAACTDGAAARDACGICSIGCQEPNCCDVCPPPPPPCSPEAGGTSPQTSGAGQAAASFAALAAAALML